VRHAKTVNEMKDSKLVELQEKVNIINDLIEKNYTKIAEKNKIIAQNNVQIVELEKLQNKYEQKIVAKKYLIGEKHCIWDQIKKVMQQFKTHFDVIVRLNIS
jgi:D-serine dehydratase